jgi:electron transport complex protein RnfA
MISAILTDNFVLSKFMGICPFIGVSKKLSSSIGMGAAVIFVMTCATAFTYPAYKYMLEPLGLTYLRIILFILIIALFVQLVEIVMKKVMPPLYSSLGVYLPLITTNCAVLGVTMLNIDNGYTFWESIANAAFAGVGFTLVLVLFAGVREKMEGCDIPAALKGLPITLVAASIMALSFMGFSF